MLHPVLPRDGWRRAARALMSGLECHLSAVWVLFERRRQQPAAGWVNAGACGRRWLHSRGNAMRVLMGGAGN